MKWGLPVLHYCSYVSIDRYLNFCILLQYSTVLVFLYLSVLYRTVLAFFTLSCLLVYSTVLYVQSLWLQYISRCSIYLIYKYCTGYLKFVGHATCTNHILDVLYCICFHAIFSSANTNFWVVLIICESLAMYRIVDCLPVYISKVSNLACSILPIPINCNPNSSLESISAVYPGNTYKSFLATIWLH